MHQRTMKKIANPSAASKLLNAIPTTITIGTTSQSLYFSANRSIFFSWLICRYF